MAPRRNNNSLSGGGGGGNNNNNNNHHHHTGGIDVHNLLAGLPDTIDLLDSHHNHNNNNNNQSLVGLNETNYMRCCVPDGVFFKSDCDFRLISVDDLRNCIRVLCNNENCTSGQYMHRKCFEEWEQYVLAFLKSSGRARSWSDRQCHTNLWSKKGYDLVFKECGCKCGRGFLKKDLDWMPPLSNNGLGRLDEEATKKKKKRNRNNQKPSLVLVGNGSSAAVGHHHYQNQTIPTGMGSIMAPIELRTRTGSLSSSNDGSSSPPASSEHSISPVHSGAAVKKNKPSSVEAYSERVRTTSGCNGIFSRRLDFSTFNVLPRTRLNSYQIKMEDEGNHGNDETRLFILSSLAQHQKSRVSCILCEEPMLVFDRYPLVDGTFFLSPKQHAQGCIEVKYDGHNQYLTAVCMGCLEGVSADRIIKCRYCAHKWDGSSLVLGTMYAYDIFAAMPCCTERLKCNNCFAALLFPHQRLNFFSDYSHVVTCVHCTKQDTHFVKPLGFCYTKQQAPQACQQWP